MTIKVLEKTEGCLPRIIKKGDWIDLTTACDVVLTGPYAETLYHIKHNGKDKEEKRDRVRHVVFTHCLIPLGVAMELPKGCEAIVAPRSSSFWKWGITQTNSIGVIDGSYNSDKDEWKLPVLAIEDKVIPKGTRIAQFRIQLSQKATMWQKIKWLFSSSIKIKQVDSLDNPERSGFGSTGD